jgi:undecaprenyl-diphosphatase
MLFTSLLTLDHQLFKLLNGLAGKSAVADWIYVSFAEGIIYLMIAGLIIFLFLKRKNRLGFITGLEAGVSALFARGVFVPAIRALFLRERPFVSGEVVQLVYHNPAENSFPSGHASVMFALAFSFFLRKEYTLGTIYLVFAIISSASRVIVGVHFPYDIFAGALVGIAAAMLTKLIVNSWFKRKGIPLLQPSKSE